MWVARSDSGDSAGGIDAAAQVEAARDSPGSCRFGRIEEEEMLICRVRSRCRDQPALAVRAGSRAARRRSDGRGNGSGSPCQRADVNAEIAANSRPPGPGRLESRGVLPPDCAGRTAAVDVGASETRRATALSRLTCGLQGASQRRSWADSDGLFAVAAAAWFRRRFPLEFEPTQWSKPRVISMADLPLHPRFSCAFLGPLPARQLQRRRRDSLSAGRRSSPARPACLRLL